MPFKRWIYQLRFALHYRKLLNGLIPLKRCMQIQLKPEKFDWNPIKEAEAEAEWVTGWGPTSTPQP